jgi:hypothetical protein
VATAKEDGVWTAQVAIPFSACPDPNIQPPGRGTVWCANFCRYVAQSGQMSAWSNTPGNPGFRTKELVGVLRFK